MREVSDFEALASHNGSDSIDPRVANFEELVEQAELIHQLQRGGVDGVTAEIAKEVLVLFKYGDGESGAGEQQPEHHAGRPSSDDAGRLHKRTLLYDAVRRRIGLGFV